MCPPGQFGDLGRLGTGTQRHDHDAVASIIRPALLAAARFPFRRAQHQVSISVISRTESSSISAASTTTSLRFGTDNNASMHSTANLAKRSQCSTTMVLSTNLYFVRSYVGSGAG